MAISSISDIIIALTLVLNGLALSSSKLTTLTADPSVKAFNHNINTEESDTTEDSLSDHTNNDEYLDLLQSSSTTGLKSGRSRLISSQPMDANSGGDEIYLMFFNRVKLLLLTVKKFSFVIAFWNIVFIFLMMFVFNNRKD